MHANNLYQILGVSHSANKQTIRQAYLRLAKKYHPDNSCTQAMQANEELFKQITNAYDTLGDDEKRKRYNMTLMFSSDMSENDPSHMRSDLNRRRSTDQHSRFYAAMKQYQHETGFAEPDGVTEEFLEHERRVAKQRQMTRHMLLVGIALFFLYRFSVYVMLVKRREKEEAMAASATNITSADEE